MKVKVRDQIYDGHKEVITVILDDKDKENIANMFPECTKYTQFPEDCDPKEIEKWMNNINSSEKATEKRTQLNEKITNFSLSSIKSREDLVDDHYIDKKKYIKELFKELGFKGLSVTKGENCMVVADIDYVPSLRKGKNSYMADSVKVMIRAILMKAFPKWTVIKHWGHPLKGHHNWTYNCHIGNHIRSK